MKIDKKLLALGTAAACTWLGGNSAHAADSHSIIINAVSSSKCVFNDRSSTIALSIDPAATTTVTSTSNVIYRCTTGTTPSFAFASANTGKLVQGTENFSYSYTSSGNAPGTGMAAGQTKTLVVTAAVDQTLAADKPPGTYTDTLTVTVTP